jgi:pimeloyl-ACP methyl ester carboxylesterase
MIGFTSKISQADISADLPRIKCQALVITTEGSALGTVEETRAWQQRIANSRLLALPGDSYHVAASDAERCAAEVLAFISGSSGGRAH